MDNQAWEEFKRACHERDQALHEYEKDFELAKMANKNQFMEFDYENMEYKPLNLDNEIIAQEKVEEIKQVIQQKPVELNQNQETCKNNTSRLFNNFVQTDDEMQVQAENLPQEIPEKLKNQMPFVNSIQEVRDTPLIKPLIEFGLSQKLSPSRELLSCLDHLPFLKYLNLKGSEITKITKSSPMFIPNLKTLNIIFRKTLPFGQVYRLTVHFDSILQFDFKENLPLKRTIEIFESFCNDTIQTLSYSLNSEHAIEKLKLSITLVKPFRNTQILQSESLDKYAEKIQRKYRIYRARQKMKRILAAIKYYDEEDELEAVDVHFEEPDYDSFEPRTSESLNLDQIILSRQTPIEDSDIEEANIEDSSVESKLLNNYEKQLNIIEEESKDKYAAKIQSRYRVYKARQKMKNILRNIKYSDDSEDELEAVDLDFKEPDYSAFELKIPYDLSLEQILALVSAPIEFPVKEASTENPSMESKLLERYKKERDALEDKIKEKCAIAIQRRYRGYKEQQKMKKLLRTIKYNSATEEVELETLDLESKEPDYYELELKISDNFSPKQILSQFATPEENSNMVLEPLESYKEQSRIIEQESRNKYAIKIQRWYRIYRERQRMKKIIKFDDKEKYEFEVIDSDFAEPDNGSFELVASDDLNLEQIVLSVSAHNEDLCQREDNMDDSDLSFNSLDSNRKESSIIEEESREEYARKIQKTYRSYKARQRMKKILRDIKYNDDEDELEAVDLDFKEPDYDTFELKIPDNFNFVDFFKSDKENNNCSLLFYDH